MAHVKEILFKRGSNCGNESLFCERYKKTGQSVSVLEETTRKKKDFEKLAKVLRFSSLPTMALIFS